MVTQWCEQHNLLHKILVAKGRTFRFYLGEQIVLYFVGDGEFEGWGKISLENFLILFSRITISNTDVLSSSAKRRKQYQSKRIRDLEHSHHLMLAIQKKLKSLPSSYIKHCLGIKSANSIQNHLNGKISLFTSLAGVLLFWLSGGTMP